MRNDAFEVPLVLLHTLRATAMAQAIGRPADLVIGGNDNPYLRRWHLTPRGNGPATYLHQFLRDDDDRALHDHPWPSVGIILDTGYLEHMPDGMAMRCPGDMIHRTPEHRHRVSLLRDDEGRPRPAWTLFFVGARVREWGFWCPGSGGGERFVHWREFTAGEHGELIGKGCGA